MFTQVGESRVKSSTFLFLASYAKQKSQIIPMTIRSLLRVLDYEKMRVLKKKIFHVEKNVKQKGKAPGFTRTIGYNRVPSIKIKKTV